MPAGSFAIAVWGAGASRTDVVSNARDLLKLSRLWVRLSVRSVPERIAAAKSSRIVARVTLAAAPPANSEELLQRIEDLGLSRLSSQIVEQQARSLRLVPGAASDLSFFGEPSALPEDFVRPSSRSGPLTCLLCLRLDDIAEEARRHGLPTSGWLLFFIEPSDELLFGQGAPFNDGTAAVSHIADASLTPSPDVFAGEFQRIAFEPIVTVPDLDIARQLWNLSDTEREAYDTLYSPQNGVTPGLAPPPFSMHYLFGHHSPVHSSGLPNPGDPALILLLQLQLYAAVGLDVIDRPRLLFFTEQQRPLETLDVAVQS
jgi:hypothetical protein